MYLNLVILGVFDVTHEWNHIFLYFCEQGTLLEIKCLKHTNSGVLLQFPWHTWYGVISTPEEDVNYILYPLTFVSQVTGVV